MTKLVEGMRLARWEVVEVLPPVRDGGEEGRARQRFRARCVCGHEEPEVWLGDFRAGRVTGCASDDCEREWRARERIAEIRERAEVKLRAFAAAEVERIAERLTAKVIGRILDMLEEDSRDRGSA